MRTAPPGSSASAAGRSTPRPTATRSPTGASDGECSFRAERSCYGWKVQTRGMLERQETMPAYRDKTRWRYRKWVQLRDGRRVRIWGTPALNTKGAAEAA